MIKTPDSRIRGSIFIEAMLGLLLFSTLLFTIYEESKKLLREFHRAKDEKEYIDNIRSMAEVIKSKSIEKLEDMQEIKLETYKLMATCKPILNNTKHETGLNYRYFACDFSLMESENISGRELFSAEKLSRWM